MEKLSEKVITGLRAGDSPSVIAKDFRLCCSTIYPMKKLFKDTGGYSKHPCSGRLQTVRTETFITAVKKEVNANPWQNVHQLARDHNMAKSTMRDLVIKDLKLVSGVVTRYQSLTLLQREKRLEKSKRMLSWMKSNPRKVVTFSDEKNWTVDKFLNCRNTWYLAKIPNNVPPGVR